VTFGSGSSIAIFGRKLELKLNCSRPSGFKIIFHLPVQSQVSATLPTTTWVWTATMTIMQPSLSRGRSPMSSWQCQQVGCHLAITTGPFVRSFFSCLKFLKVPNQKLNQIKSISKRLKPNKMK